MTLPDKLSRERLEYLRGECCPEGTDAEVDSMATEILELREEVERLRRSQMHVRSISPWPPVEVSSITPGPDGQIEQIPHPDTVRVRLLLDQLAQRTGIIQ